MRKRILLIFPDLRQLLTVTLYPEGILLCILCSFHFVIQTTLLLQIELVMHPVSTEKKQKIHQAPALDFKNHKYGRAQILWSFRNGLQRTVKAMRLLNMRLQGWPQTCFLEKRASECVNCLTRSVLPEDSHTIGMFPMRKHGVRRQVSHGALALGSGSLQGTLARREVRYLAAFEQLPCRRQSCVTTFTHLHHCVDETPLLPPHS